MFGELKKDNKVGEAGMRESSIERRLVDGIKRVGGMALKFTSPGHAGVPDRLVLLPGGRMVFVELKTKTGNLTPLQIETHNRLRALGAEVRTLYGKEYVEGFLREICPVGLPKRSIRLDPVAPQVRSVFGDGSR